jgi:hypothetical protein
VVKINLALGELPDFTADPGTDVGEHHTGAVVAAEEAADLGDRLVAVDVNPLVAGPDGCVAVDALLVRADV